MRTKKYIFVGAATLAKCLTTHWAENAYQRAPREAVSSDGLDGVT